MGAEDLMIGVPWQEEYLIPLFKVSHFDVCILAVYQHTYMA